MTKEKKDFIQKNEQPSNFVGFLTSFITNAFSASHFIKLFTTFSSNMKIVKCVSCKTMSVV